MRARRSSRMGTPESERSSWVGTCSAAVLGHGAILHGLVGVGTEPTVPPSCHRSDAPCAVSP